jgi:predicted O-linked N-acetylglucosamine transferase (SPINDLY family)
VAPGRLLVTEMLPKQEHLVAKRQADFFLDSLAYNAHSTAVELLWSGVPVVTLAGR